MAVFTVRMDTTKFSRSIGRLKQQAALAQFRALNRAAASARTEMARVVSSDMGIKVGTVRDEIKIREASQARLVAQVTTTGSRIPLINFGARGPEPSRGRGRGVSYRLPGGKGRIATAFIATMKSGHRGVFARVPGARRHGPAPNRSQLPIYELFGPSIAKVFRKFIPVGLARGQEALLKNLASEFRFALRGN